MPSPHRVWLVALLLFPATDARAQLIDAPVGAIGGLFGGHHSVDPNRDSQSFETTIDFGAGYDRDPILLFSTGLDTPGLTRWYAGSGAAAARYRVGSVKRNLDVRARGYVNYQSNAGDSLVGGEGSINGLARFGDRQQNLLTTELQSSYEPGWVFGAFGPSAPGAEAPPIGAAPPVGILEQRWLMLSGNSSYQHQWAPRHVTTVQYTGRRLQPVAGGGVAGGGLESDWQSANVEQSWAPSRRVSLLGNYRFDWNAQRDEGSDVIEPVRYQTIDAGVRLERRSSPVRRLSLTVRAGMTRLAETAATQRVRTTHPAVTGVAEFVPSRRLNLSAEYTRGVMVLAGVSAIPVVNDTGSLTFSSTPTSRLRLTFLGSVARAAFLTPDPSRDSTADVAGASLETRYAFANWSAVFATYSFYHHRIRDPLVVSSGFPSRYDRHSARVGLTLWVPWYGTF